MDRSIVLALALLAGGCSSLLGTDFDRGAQPPPALPEASAASTDLGPVVDASPDSTVVDASPDGACGVCPFGGTPCACETPAISNGAAVGELPTHGATLKVAATATFNTTLDCAPASILGDCASVVQPNAPALCVCRADSYAIDSLVVTGDRALVLLAHTTVSVAGTIDVAAVGYARGAGAKLYESGDAARSPDLVPLRAGESGDSSAVSGGGGGAVQISAGAAIAIGPRAKIQAGGGGGYGGVMAGAHGGYGGSILLEAPTVKVEGELLANGGGGGGGGDRLSYGDSGQNARASVRNNASGGSSRQGHGCLLQGNTSGGEGGRGETSTLSARSGGGSDFRNCLPAAYVEAGGSGGGVGVIRLNGRTAAHVVEASGAFLSPVSSRGTMTFRP